MTTVRRNLVGRGDFSESYTFPSYSRLHQSLRCAHATTSTSWHQSSWSLPALVAFVVRRAPRGYGKGGRSQQRVPVFSRRERDDFRTAQGRRWGIRVVVVVVLVKVLSTSKGTNEQLRFFFVARGMAWWHLLASNLWHSLCGHERHI